MSRRTGVRLASTAAAVVLLWTALAAHASEPLLVADPIVVSRSYERSTDRVGPRETLSHVFERHGLDAGDIAAIVAAARGVGLDPRRVRRGTEFAFRRPLHDATPDLVRTRLDDTGYVRVARTSSGEWRGELEPIAWTVATERVSGTIRSSLHDAIHGAIADSTLSYGERNRLVWSAAENVFGWVIDFTRDPRPDDGFRLVYERLISSDGDVRFGRVLSASIDLRGRPNTAYVLPDEDGNNRYYDETGRSMHRAFLMYPVRFRRISSTFSRRRFHPVLQQYRRHLGYDFAADLGTPIRATGDGEVVSAGRNGGYGLVVAIRHARGIETRYAHMSRIESGIRPGARVVQGQTIGRVGMTGLATGPHVHYEFLKNGTQVNYREVDLGDGEPVPAGLQAAFDSVRVVYDGLMLDAVAPVPAGPDGP